MKLYYSPGACSLSPHIVLEELGLPFTLEKVDLKTKVTESGTDFWGINSKGSVPCLELQKGVVLTEGPAIVQYLADQKPGMLAPENGKLERYQLQSLLNMISTELHKNFSPFFNPATTDEQKQNQSKVLGAKLDFISKTLGEQDYLTGESFSVADAYLFTVLRWAPVAKLALKTWPNVVKFMERVEGRPAVQKAMIAEGIKKAAS